MDEATSVPPPSRLRRVAGLLRGRNIIRALAGLLLLLCLYYGIGAFFYAGVDDDPGFTPPAPIEGGSHVVDMAAALVEREVVTHAWQPNDPLFMPNGMVIHPAAFQRGMQGAWARMAFELEDQIGRTRGSSRADPDLERARGLLNFPPNVWYFDFSKSFLPTITSEQNYRAGREALIAYNQRLAAKSAVFDVRTDSLAATLNRVVNDLGSQSAAVDDHLRNESGWLINFDADRLFYSVKGRLFAYHMMLRELGRDFEPLIRQNNLEGIWAQAMDTMNEVGQMRPFIVADASPNNSIFANHLAIQGFYLKRVLVQLKEMSQVLVN